MRKFTLIIIGILLALPHAVKADDQWKGTAFFDVVQIPCVKKPQVSFELGLKSTYTIDDYVGLGFGLGLRETWKFKGAPGIPLFITTHIEDSKNKFTPTFDFDMGVQVATKSCKNNSSFFINPIIGVRYDQLGIGIGYNGSQSFAKKAAWTSSINIRLSYYFGYHRTSQATAIKNFLSRFQFGIEALTAFTFSNSELEERAIDPSSAVGLNFSFLYPLTDNLEFGPVIGLMMQSCKEAMGSTNNLNWTTEHLTFVPVALRAKYRMRQLPIGPLYPFAQLDLGAKIAVDDILIKSNFLWAPTLGVSYDLRDGQSSIDLGIGYQDTKFQHNSDKSKTYGQLRISLGYTF